LTTWKSEDVDAKVYVTIEQFDVNSNGKAVFVAWWRILSSGGEKILRSGECGLTREDLSPDTNPSGAIATLSDLIADLNHQLALGLRETIPAVAQ